MTGHYVFFAATALFLAGALRARYGTSYSAARLRVLGTVVLLWGLLHGGHAAWQLPAAAPRAVAILGILAGINLVATGVTLLIATTRPEAPEQHP